MVCKKKGLGRSEQFTYPELPRCASWSRAVARGHHKSPGVTTKQLGWTLNAPGTTTWCRELRAPVVADGGLPSTATRECTEQKSGTLKEDSTLEKHFLAHLPFHPPIHPSILSPWPRSAGVRSAHANTKKQKEEGKPAKESPFPNSRANSIVMICVTGRLWYRCGPHPTLGTYMGQH